MTGTGAPGGASFVVRSWQPVTVGGTLAAAALFERWRGPGDARRYVPCHHSARLDDRTLLALSLIAAALVVGLAGAIMLDRTGGAAGPGTTARRLVAGCLAAVLVLVVAADTADATGERLARQLTADRPFDTHGCDYTPQTYVATPGWFTW